MAPQTTGRVDAQTANACMLTQADAAEQEQTLETYWGSLRIQEYACELGYELGQDMLAVLRPYNNSQRGQRESRSCVIMNRPPIARDVLSRLPTGRRHVSATSAPPWPWEER
jgi:hypothetical protein